MGRTKGINNKAKLVVLSEEEKLSLIADLLFELVMDELTKKAEGSHAIIPSQ